MDISLILAICFSIFVIITIAKTARVVPQR